MEEYIKDYILSDSTDDPILNSYIRLVKTEEASGVSVFSGGLLERPAFWTKLVRPWILEGFQELRKIQTLSKPPV